MTAVTPDVQNIAAGGGDRGQDSRLHGARPKGKRAGLPAIAPGCRNVPAGHVPVRGRPRRDQGSRRHRGGAGPG
jgi:hypothetical protein